MDNYSKIYWLTRLDNIQSGITTIFVISIIAIFIYYFIMLIVSDDPDATESMIKNYGKKATIAFWVGIISGIFLIFIPTKNDMILIYAGGKTMNYIQSDTSLNKLPYQTTTIISNYLDKTIKELEVTKK